MRIENKLYIGFCITFFVFICIISSLSNDEQFSGKVISAKCTKISKNTSIELVLKHENTKRQFRFGLEKFLCKDGVKFFEVGLPVEIYYSSIDGWFPSIHKVVLNGKDLPLRSY
ncbi:hypothetical protein AKJ18_19750 [Vibrio xuii]|nr:hypothetical protein AKJ18_19750 [Vibrio xuii]